MLLLFFLSEQQLMRCLLKILESLYRKIRKYQKSPIVPPLRRSRNDSAGRRDTQDSSNNLNNSQLRQSTDEKSVDSTEVKTEEKDKSPESGQVRKLSTEDASPSGKKDGTIVDLQRSNSWVEEVNLVLFDALQNILGSIVSTVDKASFMTV